MNRFVKACITAAEQRMGELLPVEERIAAASQREAAGPAKGDIQRALKLRAELRLLADLHEVFEEAGI